MFKPKPTIFTVVVDGRHARPGRNRERRARLPNHNETLLLDA